VRELLPLAHDVRSVVARLRTLLIAALAMLAGTLGAQTYQGHELVKAELIADTSAVIAGRPFTAGLLLRMAPGWHTYWKFPGDAGIPTEIKWQLPDGWKAGEIQWPLPLKINEPGDIQIYGYHDEVLLMTQITPPPKIDTSSIKLAAAVNWLVCEKICIPGNASLSLELPVGSQASAANDQLFQRYRAELPRDLPQGMSVSWTRNGSDLCLMVNDTMSSVPVVDFFPLPDNNTVVVGHPRLDNVAASKTIIIPLDSADAKLRALKGVLVAGDATTKRQGWAVDDREPAASAAAKAAEPSGSAARFLLFGLIGGFILNLMPCVLPVISLKIFGFIQHAGQSRRRVLRSGLAFIAGIFAWFIGLALLMIAFKSAGREMTWAFQFTNPYFVVGMSAVVLVFALNLFGVFEISLPQRANAGILGWSGREGDAGSFFQGVFATVLATPCTAPFLGTALGFAFTQSALMILLMFVAIAAGMSAPYLLLSAQPAWLRFLPRPGAWMERVKQFMGFLLLATLLFLLWVLGAERGPEAVIWIGCFLLALSIACWMKGAFLLPTTSAASRAIVIVLMLAIVLASGSYFVAGKFRATRTPTAQQPIGDWRAFTSAALQTELDQGHAVFIDFTAAWCLTCKFNEAAVLNTADVRDAFQRHDVVKFKADWTNADPEITKLLKQFGRPGVPLYVLYPAGKSGEPIVLPELLTKGILIDKLETSAASVASK
jgi:thiol:disulfide interchange protein DsbD